jgi:imidazolonepropionase-like amidohydrolase
VTAQFSPDGNSVVFERGSGDGYRGRIFSEDQGIYIVNIKSPGEPRLVTREGTNPRFSSDSKKILVQSGEGSKSALVSFDLLGSDRRVLATSERAVDFRLSPDQKWLAFEELWQAYVVPFPQANVPIDIGPEMTNLPVRKLSKDAGTYLTWSADSKTVQWSLGPNIYHIPVAQMYPGDTTAKPKPDSLFVGWDEPADIPNTDLYFVGARILPMNDMSTIENGVVHVKGNKIVEVGPADKVSVPKGAKVIDVAGKTLMPGMIDTHAHTGGDNNDVYAQRNWSFLANLAFGVTTMHDPSNNSQMIFAESELLKAGKRIGPRSFSTGTILYGAEGSFKTVINNLDDAVSAIKRTAAWGAFSVKSYNQPRREQRQQVIKAAYDLGIEVVPEGGSTLNNNITQALDGHTTIEHDIPVAPLYDPELHILGRWNTGYCPTLIVEYGGIFGENYWYQHSDVWKNERLSHFVPRVVLDPRSIRRVMAPDSEYHQFIVSKSVTDVLHRGGNVELGAHGQLQGLGAHWELWMLGQGGMTNHEALRCATWMGARALGLDKLIGSIQPGLLADIIVIDGDPLKDLYQSENVLYTMVNGRLYDSKTLEQLEPVRQPLPRGPNLEGVTGPDVNFDCLGNLGKN